VFSLSEKSFFTMQCFLPDIMKLLFFFQLQ
jgi:hypothetical protein